MGVRVNTMSISSVIVQLNVKPMKDTLVIN